MRFTVIRTRIRSEIMKFKQVKLNARFSALQESLAQRGRQNTAKMNPRTHLTWILDSGYNTIGQVPQSAYR